MPPRLVQLLTLPSRIVEYATRDQAQNAVATLSNQNLMGRLVYVREVRMTAFALLRGCTLRFSRTGNPSPASMLLVVAVEATAQVPALWDTAAAAAAAATAAQWVVPWAAAATTDSSTSPMFV